MSYDVMIPQRVTTSGHPLGHHMDTDMIPYMMPQKSFFWCFSKRFKSCMVSYETSMVVSDPLYVVEEEIYVPLFPYVFV